MKQNTQSNKRKKSISIEYKIINIEIRKFSFDNTVNVDKDGKAPLFIGLKGGFETDYDKETVVITIILTVVSEDKKEELCNLEVNYVIHIKNLNSKYRIDESSLDLPDKFVFDIINFAVGTTRGIFIAKAENTNYRNYILPLVDVKEFSDSLFGIDKKP